MPRKKQDSQAVLEPSDLTTLEMSTETATIETEVPEAAKASKSAKVRVSGERKIGQELLDFAQANQGMAPEELAFGAGYYTKETDAETGETNTRLHKEAFFRALTEASTGIAFAPTKRAYTSRRGRAPVVTLGKTGNCVVGARHTAVAGFEPGGKVHVTAEEGKIILTPYQGEEGGADESSDDDLDL